MSNFEDVKKIQLDIVEKIKKLCEDNNINFFIEGGTLLGAVRNEGYIPWDDDIDLCMLRKDYNRFIKIAKRELEYPYFVQTGFNDKGFYGGMIHVRRSDTTAILKKNYPNKKYNQGIFIDIFPLDNLFTNEKKRLFQFKVLSKILFLMYLKNDFNTENKSVIKKIIVGLIPNQKVLFSLYTNVCQWCKNSKYVDYVAYKPNINKANYYFYLKKTFFCEKKYLKFENLLLPVMDDYNDYLVKTYGDGYLIPKQQDSDHGNVFFDVDTSYIEYLNGNKKIEDFNENN